MQAPDALIQPTTDGRTEIVVMDRLGFTQKVPIGATLGEAHDAMVITPQEEDDVDRQTKISNHSCDDS